MTRKTMLEAAQRLPRSPIYGIGILRSGDVIVDYEIGWEDVDRDTAWAVAQLTLAGVTGDDHVLITTTNHEAPWLSPVVRALRQIGAVYTPAEVYGWDASRFESVIRRLPITVVIGLCEETLSSVRAQHPDLHEVFSDVRLIWARPDAYRALVSAGIEAAAAMDLVGPALGLAQPDTPEVMRVNEAEWALDRKNGSITVSAVASRRARLTDITTDIVGTVEGMDAIRLRH